MTKQQAFKMVLDDLMKIGLFRGEYDIKHRSINYLLGISAVMEHIAYLAGEEEYDKYLKIFYENLQKSEGQND